MDNRFHIIAVESFLIIIKSILNIVKNIINLIHAHSFNFYTFLSKYLICKVKSTKKEYNKIYELQSRLPTIKEIFLN